MELIKALKDCAKDDVAVVGGKNSSLGELISQLASAGVNTPGGFATTAYAYERFCEHNGLNERIAAKLASLDVDDTQALAAAGAAIRQMFCAAEFSADFLDEFNKQDFSASSYAVRSSATAEDLPDASFAGQQETFLHISGKEAILAKIKEVYASLYNDRAISYRVHKGFAHEDVSISAGVQQMVCSDASGVAFSLDTESGFSGAVFITSSYGLGECVVQGSVNPDEFYVSKTALKAGKKAILGKNLGSKMIKMRFSAPGAKDTCEIVNTTQQERDRFSLSDEQACALAKLVCAIESHYGCAMDVEWAIENGVLYILQARPETVQSQTHKRVQYVLKSAGKVLIKGRAIGQKIAHGRVKVLNDLSQMHKIEPGDVLVTDMTDPNWEPVMKKAAGIITNRGGRTCHAAIIARELEIAAVVGTANATELLKDGDLVTICCAQGDEGVVYEGRAEYEAQEISASSADAGVKLYMNIGNPALAFGLSQKNADGVGLARLEFIINNIIAIHPNACIDYDNGELKDSDVRAQISERIRGYESASEYFIQRLAQGVATIAAAFHPRPVIIRMSDFKSNEYRKLIGGALYEPLEENPMLGFRGASRYLAPSFAPCFAMEMRALRIARSEMGFSNIELMIPFVRTLNQAASVMQLLAQNGLQRGVDGLRVIMMCELPTNALLAEQFLEHFDGFSIGSNDLTQLSLGLDRDSGDEILAADFDERDDAVLKLIEMAIAAANKAGKYIGICGQGPSDHLDFARWLKERGISSLSLNPDSLERVRDFLTK